MSALPAVHGRTELTSALQEGHAGAAHVLLDSTPGFNAVPGLRNEGCQGATVRRCDDAMVRARVRQCEGAMVRPQGLKGGGCRIRETMFPSLDTGGDCEAAAASEDRGQGGAAARHPKAPE